MGYQVASDQALIDAARNGDKGAWERLVRKYLPMLAAYIGARLRRPEIVDELLVVSVQAAWRSRANFPDSAEFGKWFRKMGANVAMRWHRHHSEESIVGHFPTDRLSGDESSDAFTRLEVALGTLSGRHRMVLEQYFRGAVRDERLGKIVHEDKESCEKLLVEAFEQLAEALADDLVYDEDGS